MSCQRCGAPKTIEAHLIPKAFVMEVKKGRGEQHMILHQGKARPRINVTGVFDKNLLCAPCDGVLGDHENYAYRLLKDLRTHKAPPRTLVEFSPCDGEKLVRFAAGIAWKYAHTKPEFQRIDIGPYGDRLSEVAFGKTEIPPAFDVCIMRLVELGGDTYFYRTPIPDRQDGVNIVRFTVGSFVFFLKIDKRQPSGVIPDKTWMRGKTEGYFPLIPAHMFEEGRIHHELATQDNVTTFFRNMMVK